MYLYSVAHERARHENERKANDKGKKNCPLKGFHRMHTTTHQSRHNELTIGACTITWVMFTHAPLPHCSYNTFWKEFCNVRPPRLWLQLCTNGKRNCTPFNYWGQLALQGLSSKLFGVASEGKDGSDHKPQLIEINILDITQSTYVL